MKIHNSSFSTNHRLIFPTTFQSSIRNENEQIKITHRALFVEGLRFIRFNIAFFLGIVGVLGFLQFNSPHSQVFSVFLASFALVGSSYAYNSMRDKEEDLLNHGTLNFFVTHAHAGSAIILLLFGIGCVLAVSLGWIPFVLYLTLAGLGFIYSFVKIKAIFLLKNIYTALLSGVFLLGATVSSEITSIMIGYALLLSFLFFIGSILSDLRDFEGDSSAGIATIPVTWGYAHAQSLVLFLANAFFALTLVFRLHEFYIFSFFMIPVIEFISIKEVRRAHKMIQYTFLLSLVWWMQ